MSTDILQFVSQASANSFTVPMVGIGLGDLSEEELSDVIESGLFGLFGLVGPENGFTPVSVAVEGGVPFGFFGIFLLEVSRVDKEAGCSLPFFF